MQAVKNIEIKVSEPPVYPAAPLASTTHTAAERQGKPQAKTTLNLNLCTYNAQRTVVDADNEKPGEPQNINRVTAKLK
eukprot:1574429-Pyramimonas_sp.AAC.1